MSGNNLFSSGQIKTVQIQTIDDCNLNCIVCPNSRIQKTGQVMSDEIFEKILKEIKPYVRPDFRMCLFLENEPLMDKNIFDRAKRVKEVFPQSELFLITNSVYTKKYKKEIVENFDIVSLNIYGKNFKTFNKFTNSNISDDFYNEMTESAYEVEGKMKADPKKFARVRNDFDSSNLWSRGGFLNNWKIINKANSVICDKNEPFEFFNFLADGSFILCCMDYTKETAMGNIKDSSLKSIFDGKKAQRIINQARGLERADENFICRRCERSKGLHI